MKHNITLNRSWLCIGHRGAAGHAPENTLLSVRKAIELGADWIEIDVHAVAGELVVIHDFRLEHTTNGRGYVAQQSVDYLRSLDAGGGQKIPFLGEVFDLVDRRVGINIEIKSEGSARPLVELIDRYLSERQWRYEEIIVSSFNHRELAEVKSLRPKLKIGVLISGVPLDYTGAAQTLGAVSVHLGVDFLNRQLVEDAHRRGLKAFAHTVNHPEDLQHVRALGVDGVFTDYPERAREP
jgi:glycerophosphoryl diester phosphodiesterase